MKKELRKVRNYRATNTEENLIKELYMQEIMLSVKTNKTSIKSAKKECPFSRWKVAKLLRKSVKVLM